MSSAPYVSGLLGNTGDISTRVIKLNQSIQGEPCFISLIDKVGATLVEQSLIILMFP